MEHTRKNKSLESPAFLHESDYELMFTKDPNAFISGLWVKLDQENSVERCQLIFRKWLEYYSKDFRTTIAKSVEIKFQNRLAEHAETAFVNGKKSALSSLPLKKTLFGEKVDLDKVMELMKGLGK